MCEVWNRVRVDVITDHTFSLLLGEKFLIFLFQDGTDFSLKFFQHECDVRTLELLAEVLIYKRVYLLKLGESYESLKLDQMLRKFSENRVGTVNQLNDLPIFTFKQTKEIL